jgi:hypothetical protein
VTTPIVGHHVLAEYQLISAPRFAVLPYQAGSGGRSLSVASWATYTAETKLEARGAVPRDIEAPDGKQLATT